MATSSTTQSFPNSFAIIHSIQSNCSYCSGWRDSTLNQSSKAMASMEFMIPQKPPNELTIFHVALCQDCLPWILMAKSPCCLTMPWRNKICWIKPWAHISSVAMCAHTFASSFSCTHVSLWPLQAASRCGSKFRRHLLSRPTFIRLYSMCMCVCVYESMCTY